MSEELECGVFSEFGQDVLARELKEFKDLMQANDFQFFLIGGCCLGLVREGQFLEHDKDIDIGIFDNIDLEKLKKVLETAYINVSIYGEDNGKIVWANKEINGALLVFEVQVHYRKDGKIFINRDLGKSTPTGYRDGRMEWDEIYFDRLQPTTFPNGEEYLVPDYIEEYLTVQHGNWRMCVEYKDWRYNVRNLVKGWK